MIDRIYSETKRSQDDIVIQLLGIAITAINTTKDLVPIACTSARHLRNNCQHFDYCAGVLSQLSQILVKPNVYLQSVIKNEFDFRVIANKCETIKEILERVTKGATNDNLPRYLMHATSQLNIVKEGARFWMRFIAVTIDHDMITAWEKDIDCVLGFFNFEAITGMAIDMNSVKEALELVHNVPSTNTSKNCQIKPPSRPTMLYGRDDLVAELTNVVINNEHLALIGPRGVGKSSVAKAIINEPLITDKFADKRFFVTYDRLNPSAITLEAFIACFAGTIGIDIAGTDLVGRISTFLHSAKCALIVLDNVETFEKVSGSSALEKIHQSLLKLHVSLVSS
ncbi:hypothetical protein BDR04DRAFT_1149610 [Suillus decipiens]|nr:hypothetical protein BDR04DRAFT_1149610 [Suillus decipiens]